MNAEDLQKLVTITMPFDKHRGMRIADPPGNYLYWFVRDGVPKDHIGRLIALM